MLSNASADIAVIDLVRMAASRFWVERALQEAKGAVGMAEYQMRSWAGWHPGLTHERYNTEIMACTFGYTV